MRRIIRIVCMVLALGMLLVLVPSESSLAEIVPISIDAEAAKAPDESHYISETEYEDPSLRVVIQTGWVNSQTEWWMARVRIADPSQLRSAAATPNGQGTANGITMTRRVNAVLAINGDFWPTNKQEYGKHIVRQGVEKKHNAGGQFDALIIDENADFHIIRDAKESDFANFEGTIVNSYAFGPALIVDGEKITEFKTTASEGVGKDKVTQRMCIAQTGPLEYMIVCCSGPEDHPNGGLTIPQFVDLIDELGGGRVINAYNLDGGTSSWLIFHHEKINCPNNPKRRQLADIIYFASAWED